MLLTRAVPDVLVAVPLFYEVGSADGALKRAKVQMVAYVLLHIIGTMCAKIAAYVAAELLPHAVSLFVEHHLL